MVTEQRVQLPASGHPREVEFGERVIPRAVAGGLKAFPILKHQFQAGQKVTERDDLTLSSIG